MPVERSWHGGDEGARPLAMDNRQWPQRGDFKFCDFLIANVCHLSPCSSFYSFNDVPLTLNLTSCKFYLIRIRWVLYMTLTSCSHWLTAAKWKTISSFSKNWVLGRFPLPLGLRQRTDSESLFPGSSGHIFNFCLAPPWAEKTQLESGDTD
jgi:hypothetical protein